jgi:hypothetical protein
VVRVTSLEPGHARRRGHAAAGHLQQLARLRVVDAAVLFEQGDHAEVARAPASERRPRGRHDARPVQPVPRHADRAAHTPSSTGRRPGQRHNETTVMADSMAESSLLLLPPEGRKRCADTRRPRNSCAGAKGAVFCTGRTPRWRAASSAVPGRARRLQCEGPGAPRPLFAGASADALHCAGPRWRKS